MIKLKHIAVFISTLAGPTAALACSDGSTDTMELGFLDDEGNIVRDEDGNILSKITYTYCQAWKQPQPSIKCVPINNSNGNIGFDEDQPAISSWQGWTHAAIFRLKVEDGWCNQEQIYKPNRAIVYSDQTFDLMFPTGIQPNYLIREEGWECTINPNGVSMSRNASRTALNDRSAFVRHLRNPIGNSSPRLTICGGEVKSSRDMLRILQEDARFQIKLNEESNKDYLLSELEEKIDEVSNRYFQELLTLIKPIADPTEQAPVVSNDEEEG